MHPRPRLPSHSLDRQPGISLASPAGSSKPGSGLLAIAEGWHRGPTATPEENPAKLGSILMDLQSRARKNAGMDGMDLD